MKWLIRKKRQHYVTRFGVYSLCVLLSYPGLWLKVTAAERTRMIMRRILNHGTLQRLAATHPLLLGVAVPEAPAAFCCCLLRFSLPPLSGRRWLSTSAFSKAAHLPKPQTPHEEPRPHSTQEQKREAELDAAEMDPLQDDSIGLVQRFKRTFKQYGKVMIPVHLVTSSVWFGTFYYAAMKWVLFWIYVFAFDLSL